MLYIVSTDLRIRLARAPFEAKYRPFLDRIQLMPYAELLADEIDLDATYLFCSVAAFSPWQREAACLWESSLSSAHPQARIVNRPGKVAPWEVLMAGLREQGRPTVETWSLREQLARPRFPVVLRHQSPEFQLESPVIDDDRAIPEIVDRMVMAGGSPELIRSVGMESLAGGPTRIRLATLLRVGDRFFPSGDWRSPDCLEQLKAIARALPLEAAAFDFLIDEQGPCLWRIDDELCRILPDLVGPGSDRPKFVLEEALLALDRSSSSGARGAVEIDRNSLRLFFIRGAGSA